MDMNAGTKIVNKYDSIILLGLGGLGAAIYRQMWNYLDLYGYLAQDGRHRLKPMNIYVWDGDRISDEYNAVKVGFVTAAKYDRHSGTDKMTMAELYIKNVDMENLDRAVKQLFLTPEYFGEEHAEVIAANRADYGRILLIDATDHKKHLFRIYSEFLMPDDTLILAGYDMDSDSFSYTIYINPVAEIIDTLRNVYDSIPLSPMHAEAVAAELWMLVAHYDLSNLRDADITRSFKTDLFDYAEEVGVRTRRRRRKQEEAQQEVAQQEQQQEVAQQEQQQEETQQEQQQEVAQQEQQQEETQQEQQTEGIIAGIGTQMYAEELQISECDQSGDE